MPDHASEVRRALERFQRRYRVLAIADALMAGAGAAGLVVMSAAALPFRPPHAAAYAAQAFAVVFAIVAVRGWRAWTGSRVARAIEQRSPGFDNLLVTAEEALAGRPLHPVLAHELFDQAAARLRRVEVSSASQQIAGRAGLALGMFVAVGVLILRGGALSPAGSFVTTARNAVADLAGTPARLRVTVIPPPYTRGQPATVDDPIQVHALEGSTVRLELDGVTDLVQLIEPGRDAARFQQVNGTARLDVLANASRVLLIRRPTVAGDDRLLQLQVQPDQRPAVTIEQPARDLLFATPEGRVPVRVTARDDLQLASLELRYTRIAGSGETFAFQEGSVPLSIQGAGTASGTAWRGDGVISLAALKLEDGDTLVYRALARDHKPGADPATSESFLIEIGKRSESTSAGFALPDEKDRQALSQQMLIMKTERLIAERPTLAAGAVLERSRLLAIEQRMVRSEFVFMSGGEVQDEVEEAAHAHELVEGRFENEGQVELLNAIREMSRAEARLNAADTAQALVFERAALAALQKAFDRRRYFLRTLPERTRIDPARRLSGDVSTARSSTRTVLPAGEDPVATSLRELLRDLETAVRTGTGLDARLAARLLSADPQSAALQKIAVQMSGASRSDDKARSAVAAREPVIALLRQRLSVAPARQLPRDPLLGHLADQLQRLGVAR